MACSRQPITGIPRYDINFTACFWALLSTLNAALADHPGNISRYQGKLPASAMRDIPPIAGTIAARHS